MSVSLSLNSGVNNSVEINDSFSCTLDLSCFYILKVPFYNSMFPTEMLHVNVYSAVGEFILWKETTIFY